MRIRELVAERGGALIRSAFLFLLVVVIGLSIGLVGVDRAEASGYQGKEYGGLYYYTVVEFFAMPSVGGTVTRPNGVDHTLAVPVQSPSVPGGAGYYTGTRLPTMAVGYATAPMDFTATAVPADGYKFSHWQGVDLPRRWWEGTGEDLRVTYLEEECDDYFGYFAAYAVFVPTTVSINLMASTGFTYDVPSGLRTFGTIGLTPLVCHMQTAYTEDYEFDSWVGSRSLVGAIEDETNPSTYLNVASVSYMQSLGETDHWVYPRMRLKEETVNEVTFSIQVPGEGTLWWESDNFSVGESFVNYWTKGISDYDFVRWDVDNLGCSDRYGESATFWVLEEGAATAEAILEDDPERGIFSLTMVIQGNGETIPEEGVTYLQENVATEIRAVADTGWMFDHWLGLPGGVTSHKFTEEIKLSENTTITAVFTQVGGGGGDDEGPGAVATGMWGRVRNTLNDVGLDNSMGRMFVVIIAMVVMVVVARDNKVLRVVLPLAVLGLGILGGWVPIWIVVLLALGVGVFIVKQMSGVTGGGYE